MQRIENLIIDLGGVLYAIDPGRANYAFAQLMGGKPGDLDIVLHQVQHNPFWKDFERGQMNEAAFRAQIRANLRVDVSDDEIDAAWNALLIGPIKGRPRMLEQLASKYRLILLSNTNSIHFNHLSPHSKSILDPFEKLFLSYEMGHRKPERDIYEMVLAWGDLDPDRTLFIDDSEINISGARTVGLKAEYVEANNPMAFTELMKTLL